MVFLWARASLPLGAQKPKARLGRAEALVASAF